MAEEIAEMTKKAVGRAQQQSTLHAREKKRWTAEKAWMEVRALSWTTVEASMTLDESRGGRRARMR